MLGKSSACRNPREKNGTEDDCQRYDNNSNHARNIHIPEKVDKEIRSSTEYWQAAYFMRTMSINLAYTDVICELGKYVL